MNPLPWDGHWYAWRLDREVYGSKWDSGMGSKLKGGRWNTPGRRVVYASVDPSSAILEVAANRSFAVLDTEPYVLTCFEVISDAQVKVVQPEEVPNPYWLSPTWPSPNQQRFADDLLAEHPFVLIPSVATRHSWNLLVSCELAEGQFQMISQERFGLDTRLLR
ncbi:RES domain-containing protein [Pseudomonas sp. TH08]|uniref:RES family NAD+ phosphorylase n=1 Tax=unclassified Pseudomonas TaxID=196821 RepID=UPI001913EA40|nr:MULTISPECIES: RES domain-containing protein [unclassified Pseudomonas]MBK5373077.1 RES domain-containing protein [Pseudomonas sp. TH43]MBK5511914.1 RES domain-containing protein [Pseudomonas sp. TH15]MBK5534898.1 RES domain-containing protein [Pseudomonas sp. TH08]